jgi:hypothetical protein
MSEDNVVSEKSDSKPSRGERGDVGVASAGDTMKKLHRATGRGLSLRVFARQLLKDGDPVAKEWFSNKKGAKNQKRSEKNIAAAQVAASATKASRKKMKK